MRTQHASVPSCPCWDITPAGNGGVEGTPLIGFRVNLIPGQPVQVGGQLFPGVLLARLSGGLAVVGDGSQDTACQGTPKLGSLRVFCHGGGQVTGKEVPLVGIAQPRAGCRRTSHSSGQSQSVTKTNVGRRTLSQAQDNNEYFSLLADAFVLAANAEVCS